MKRPLFVLLTAMLLLAPCHAGVPIDLHGPPKMHLELDQLYEMLLVNPRNDGSTPGLHMYMFNPPDRQSSATLTCGDGGYTYTEEAIAEKYAGAKVTKKPGTIGGMPVVWWSWKDSRHVYLNCDTLLKGAKGKEYKISLFIVANTSARLAVLETAFSSLTLK